MYKKGLEQHFFKLGDYDNRYKLENTKLNIKKGCGQKGQICNVLGIKFKKGLIWDIASFRPDPRDYPSFIKEVVNGKNFIVVYEKIIVCGTKIELPRFIFWEKIIFVNIR